MTSIDMPVPTESLIIQGPDGRPILSRPWYRYLTNLGFAIQYDTNGILNIAIESLGPPAESLITGLEQSLTALALSADDHAAQVGGALESLRASLLSNGDLYQPVVPALTEAEIQLRDVTTNDVSIVRHGLTPKLPNDATKYLDGTGAYSVPPGTGSGTVTTTGSPASGNLTKFSGATSITNGDLSGDVTTSGTLVTTIKTDVALGGNPTTTTQSAGNSSTRIATTAFVASAVSSGTAGAAYHPGFVSGRYYTSLAVQDWGTLNLTANRLYAIPFYCPFTQTFTKLSASVTGAIAASSIELGIYTNSNGIPNQLLVDGGSISSASTGLKEATGLTINCTPGWYWLVIASDAAITVQGFTDAAWLTGWLLGVSSPGTAVSSLYGSWTFSAANLPASFPAVTYLNLGHCPTVYIRL